MVEEALLVALEGRTRGGKTGRVGLMLWYVNRPFYASLTESFHNHAAQAGANLMLFIAVYQLFDDAQATMAGALRGYKDTRLPMVITAFAYWALGFPLAYLAAITYELAPEYIWGGFVLGLSVAAVLLSWRYLRLSREAIQTLPIHR